MGTRLLAVVCALALGLAAPSLAQAADIGFASSASFVDTVTEPSAQSFVRYCTTSAQCAAFGFGPIAPQVRWGAAQGSLPSGLGFVATPPQTVQSGTPFSIGQLTHFNFPIAAGTFATQTTLQLAATVTATATHAVAVPVVLSIDETPNSGTCVYPSASPCADAITWRLPEPIVVLDGATAYVLNVDGVRATADASSAPLQLFVSQEGSAQSGFLFARLDEHVASAADDAYATPQDTALTVGAPGLLANDGDATDASLAGPPSHGTVVVAADGGFTYTPAAGFVGTDSFTYVAKTPLGAWAIAQATIDVTDATPPALTSPGDLTAEATGPDGAVVSFDVSAADAVDGAVEATCSPASGSTFPLGSTAVSCSATDAAGNTGSAGFTVTVRDTTAPVLALPAPISVVTATGGAAVTYAATATDLVDGAVAPVCAPASGSTFPVGTTAVACTATDAHGNAASASFAVTVTGVGDLLDELADLSTGLPPGKSLPMKARNARAAFDRGDVPVTCSLLGAFASEVAAQDGKKLTHAQAADLQARVEQIRSALGC